MQEGYGLRAQAPDTGAVATEYALLPGTNILDNAELIPTAAKTKLMTSGREVAGCHPSRWVYELLHNNFTVCDMFDRARRFKKDGPFAWQHTHRLVINGNQSYAAESNRVLSSVCLDCHHHLIFRMAWDSHHAGSVCHQQQACWPLPDSRFPWHHLTWVGSESDPNVMASATKYYPLLAREFFICTAAPCTFELTLEVSEPRLTSWIIDLLQDREKILESLNQAREQEPSRYEGATDDWAVQAPLNLNTYLKNLLESEPDQVRSISKRNKRFAVLFGPRCFPLFHHLEFEDNVLEREGVDEGNFKPPAPDPPKGPNGTTEVGTYRGFLEDVRSEVQCLIHKAGQSTESPTFCTSNLHANLGSQEVPNVSSNALVETGSYRLLGVLPAQSREIVVNAYKRQWDRLPSQRRQIVDALMAVASNSGDEQLSEYAITQSSVFDSQTQSAAKDDDDGVVLQALAYLGLQPPNNHSAEVVLQAFRNKIAASPGDAATARSMLSLIASSSTDDNYQIKLVVEADDSRMSFETARAVVGIESSGDSGPELLGKARTKLAGIENYDAKVTILDAFNALADHIDSPELKHGVADLRRENSIRTTGPIDHSSASRPVDWALPVGLNNIGNTCYLNSLLQYLYTVKAVRDIANNYDAFRLELTDEAIQQRRLGGNKMQMDRGEAVVAQAFVHELSDLFSQLKTSDKAATRPSQRLANAVLLSTHSLLEGPKASAMGSKDSQPPPLPARPSPAPPGGSKEAGSAGEEPGPEIPLSLTRNDSAETLIGHEELDSEPSYEKVEHVPSTIGNRDTPPVAEISHEDAQMQDHGAALELEVTESASEGVVAVVSEPPDAVMEGVEEAETVDKKVLDALEHQKRSSGTDQQDVEEVIGSIINRLQAAIQPSRVDKDTGIQLEKIMETFFVTTVNYTKKFDDKEYQHEISFDRSITAFPAPDGPCSLYDALGRNFDQQILEESKLSRYTAIKTLPPVLHVLIQRSQSIGRKNGNPVIIPETLYLDRYMDASHKSAAFRRRVEDWSIAARIEEIKSQKARIDTSVSTGGILEPIRLGILAAPGQVAGPQNEKASVFETETWDFDGPVDEDFTLINPVAQPKLSDDLAVPLPQEDMSATEAAIQELMEAELQERERALEEHQEASKEIGYRLHAVICHRGHLSSGHYWVWIRDFEDDLWRWYNDADVKENKNTEEVLKTLSSSGEPYYLCYVRDSDKQKYVDVPKRQRPEGVRVAEQQATSQDASQQISDVPLLAAQQDADGDVALDDGGAAPSVSKEWGGPQTGTPPQDDDRASEPHTYNNW